MDSACTSIKHTTCRRRLLLGDERHLAAATHDAGADVVAAPLAPDDRLVQIVLDRYDAAT